MLNYVKASKIKQAVTTAGAFAEVGDLENWLILIKYTYKRLQNKNTLSTTDF